MEKTCLIINFWLGDRRRHPNIYHIDKLIYLKTQISYLETFENNLSTIYFNFNVEVGQFNLLNEALKLIPSNINGSKVKINIRENKGFSYGAWNDIASREIDNYDYFIFNEDDYFFNQPKWDSYLVSKYKSKEDMGYLAMGVRPHKSHNNFRFLFHSVGMSSRENLKKIIEKFGNLVGEKHLDSSSYPEGQQLQDTWGELYSKIGLINYDVRDDYHVEFGLTDRKENIWKLWTWNKNILIKNAASIFPDRDYRWFICHDSWYLEGYTFPY
jgi:hypothetical protein